MSKMSNFTAGVTRFSSGWTWIPLSSISPAINTFSGLAVSLVLVLTIA